MKVPYYKGQKLTRLFSQKNSGSLIIHENVSKNEEKKIAKKNREFFRTNGLRILKDNDKGYLRWKNEENR